MLYSLLIKKLNPDVVLPAYKTNGASGMDLMAFIDEPIKIAPNSSYLVPTGLSIAFSEDYELQIRPRSGLAAKNSITILAYFFLSLPRVVLIGCAEACYVSFFLSNTFYRHID